MLYQISWQFFPSYHFPSGVFGYMVLRFGAHHNCGMTVSAAGENANSSGGILRTGGGKSMPLPLPDILSILLDADEAPGTYGTSDAAPAVGAAATVDMASSVLAEVDAGAIPTSVALPATEETSEAAASDASSG